MTTPDPAQLMQAQSEYDDKKKSPVVTWLLWLFTGVVGGHRFYLGDTTRAIFMLITLGGFGFWALLDGFAVNGALRRRNEEIKREVWSRHGLPL